MLSGIISSVSGAVNTSGSNLSIDSNVQFISTDENNIAIGEGAMATGTNNNIDYNVAIGYNALTDLTQGDSNTAIGYRALANEDEDSENVAIGYNALATQNAATDAAKNTAIGSQAGLAVTTSVQNVIIGYKAMVEHTTGHSNTAIGYQAMSNTNDSANTLASSHNVFIGNNSGSGIWGNGAGGGLSCDKNVALGNSTLSGALNNADDNTAIGYQAGNSITTGTQNVLIGSGTDTSAVGGTNQIVIGYNAAGVGDNKAVIGNASISEIHMNVNGDGEIHANGTIQTSDMRFKENIKECDLGLAFIKKINPVKYNFKKDDNTKYGIIAQEVLKTLEDVGIKESSFIKTNNPDKLGADYVQFIAPLIKAVQELSQQIKDLKKG
tara:strand:- start:196 stop:1338 length:1143 start_codon:yes stop_codon:yes gene_type:complete